MANEKREDERIGGMKLREEEIGYSSDQMNACAKCGKANPPNRTNCLYCAAPIANVTEGFGTPKLNLRQLENWENGYNVVALGSVGRSNGGDISKLLGNDVEDIEILAGAASAVPLARLESESDAAIACDHLTRLGIHVRVIGDVALKMGKPSLRSRTVEFLPDAIRFISFNTGESKIVPLADIVLLVVGTVTESKTESVEKRRKKGERKSLSESATSSDDLVVDIYSGEDEQGWRIMTKGFDFSCLGAEKTMLAGENIGRLIERVRSVAPDARFVDDYDRIENAMSAVWDIDRRKDFEGLKRTGILQSGFSSVVRTSNAEQFSKYSRLQRILL